MSVHVGHLAFFSLAADRRPLQNKMFATKTSCTIQFFDIFDEISMGNRPRELLYCKGATISAASNLAKKNCRTSSTSFDNSKIDLRFRTTLKVSYTTKRLWNSPGELLCFFAVQNRWGARENHGEWKREYNSTRSFIPIFMIAIDLKL